MKPIKEVVLVGIGMQCHSPEFVVKNERTKDVIQLHYSNIKECQFDFWEEFNLLRKEGVLRFPLRGDHRLVVISTPRTSLDIDIFNKIQEKMLNGNYFGWMTPERILVLKKTGKEYAFNKVCSSLNLHAVL